MDHREMGRAIFTKQLRLTDADKTPVLYLGPTFSRALHTSKELGFKQARKRILA
jgi:hypothetical protein